MLVGVYSFGFLIFYCIFSEPVPVEQPPAACGTEIHRLEQGMATFYILKKIKINYTAFYIFNKWKFTQHTISAEKSLEA